MNDFDFLRAMPRAFFETPEFKQVGPVGGLCMWLLRSMMVNYDTRLCQCSTSITFPHKPQLDFPMFFGRRNLPSWGILCSCFLSENALAFSDSFLHNVEREVFPKTTEQRRSRQTVDNRYALLSEDGAPRVSCMTLHKNTPV